MFSYCPTIIPTKADKSLSCSNKWILLSQMNTGVLNYKEVFIDGSEHLPDGSEHLPEQMVLWMDM